MLKRKSLVWAIVALMVLVLGVVAAACGEETTETTAAPSTTAAPATQTTAAPSTSETTATTAAATPVTLKLQGAFPEGGTHYYYLDTFSQKVKEYSGGTLTVEWGAGPEAIPANELAEAMVNDSVQMVFSPFSYLTSHFPVGAAVKLLDPSTCRTNGGFEYINELTEKQLNAHFLGRMSDGLEFVLALKKPIKTLDDFKGLKIRATASQRPLVEALGAGVVTMALGEIYDALQRNVVDGTGCALSDIVDFSLYEVLKYLIQPGFYISDSSLFVTLGTWNKLSDVQKEALEKAALDWEKDSKVHNTQAAAEYLKKITDAGVQVINLEGDMKDAYIKLAYDAGWAEVEKADPEVAKKLRSFGTH